MHRCCSRVAAMITATAMLIAGTALAQAPANEVLDANTLSRPQSSTAYGFFPGLNQAQTFTAEHNGDVTKAQVKIHLDSCCASVDGLKANITTVDTATGLPTSNVLASTTLPSSDIPVRVTNVDPSSIPLTTLTFENPARVEAGKQYAIVLDAIAPNTPFYVVRWTTVLGDYAGGQGMWIDDNGRFAGYLPGADSQLFAIYVTTADQETTAPTTTATLSPQPNEAGWNNSDATVSLSADDQGGSGVEKITYSASGAQTIEQGEVIHCLRRYGAPGADRSGTGHR